MFTSPLTGMKEMSLPLSLPVSLPFSIMVYGTYKMTYVWAEKHRRRYLVGFYAMENVVN